MVERQQNQQVNVKQGNDKRDCCKSFYTINESLKEEGQQLEYKNLEIRNIDELFNKPWKEKLFPIICAFLNTLGGVILIGVQDKLFKVKGIEINPNQFDQLKCEIEQQTLHQFDPQPLNQLQFLKIPLKNENGEWLDDRCIIKIIVKQGIKSNQQYYTFCHDGVPKNQSLKQFKCYIRLDGSNHQLQTTDFKEKSIERYKEYKEYKEKGNKIIKYSHICQVQPDKQEIEALTNPQEKLKKEQFCIQIIRPFKSSVQQIEEWFSREFEGEQYEKEKILPNTEYLQKLQIKFKNEEQIKKFNKDDFLKQFQSKFRKLIVSNKIIHPNIEIDKDQIIHITYILPKKRKQFDEFFNNYLQEKQIEHSYIVNDLEYIIVFKLQDKEQSQNIFEKLQQDIWNESKNYGKNDKIYIRKLTNTLQLRTLKMNDDQQNSLCQKIIQILDEDVSYKMEIKQQNELTLIEIKFDNLIDIIYAFNDLVEKKYDELNKIMKITVIKIEK